MGRVDELQRAFKTFNDGIQSIAVTRAINNANDQVRRVRADVQNEQEQRALFQQIGENLASDLTRFGQSPSQVSRSVQNLIPQQPRPFATAEQALLNAPEGSAPFERALQLIGSQRSAKRQQAAQKQTDALRKESLGFIAEFRDKEVKEELKALSQADSIEALLETNTFVAFDLVKTMFIKQAGEDRITNEDIRRVSPGRDIVTRARRLISENFKPEFRKDASGRIIPAENGGGPVPEDIEALKAIGRAMKQSLKKSVRKKAGSFATSRRGFLPSGLQPSKLRSVLIESANVPLTRKEQIEEELKRRRRGQR